MKRDAKIAKFEGLAEEIRRNITSRKKPLIVEFSGMPKAGKTTIVNSLALFLRRNGISTVVVAERASMSPIKNKHHADFNLWTGCTSLANMIRFRRSNDEMVIILDRGIFDSLVWFNSLNMRGKLSDGDLEALENFFLMNRWTKDVDLVICMKTNVSKALEREFKDVLTNKPGSIMNEEFLKDYIVALDQAIKSYGSYFERLFSIDTSETQTLDGVELALEKVIESLRELSDEKLITIPLAEFNRKLDTQGFDGDRNKYTSLERVIENKKKILSRSVAEESSDHVQIVVCAMLRYEDSMAVFTKTEKSEKARLHKKRMIWIGGHLQSSDSDLAESETQMQSMKRCILREIEEELEQSIDRPLVFKGLVYDRTHSRSLQHLGVVFQIDIKSEQMMKSLNNRTIFERSGQGVHIEFVNRSQASFDEKVDSLEQWSVDILSKLYDINVSTPDNEKQMVIF